MRICVYGAGAVGGHIAARLASSPAGLEVSVVARGAQLAAIRERGLTLHHGEEAIRAAPRASASPAELGPQDFVIVALKATALGAFAREGAPLLAPETGVVFAQNGIPWWYACGLSAARPLPPDLSRLDPQGALRAAVAPAQAIGAVIYSANDLLAPGVIRNHTPGDNMLVVGECDDRDSARLRALREALQACGLASPPTADIRQAVWNKAILNLSSSTLCLLTGEPIGTVRADPALHPLLAQVAAEGQAIARAHGVDSGGAPQRPSGGHRTGPIAHKPSILHDYEHGRPMEVEAQLCAPLAFARAARVATPALDALVPLAVHKAAAKGLA